MQKPEGHPGSDFSEFTVADLNQPDVIQNPYPYYARLRNDAPQFGLLDYPPGTIPGKDEPRPAWAFLRYEDVAFIARNHETFSSRDEMQEQSSAPTLMLVNDDRPRHRFLRGIAQQAFSPKLIEEDVGPWATQTVCAMIDRIGGGELEIMNTYAVELPARFMTRLLGTPETDWPLLRDWGNAFMVTANYTADEREQSNRRLAQYYNDAVDQRIADIERGKSVGDDLMTSFITSEFEGQRLSAEEVKRFCITLVVAGAETTVYLLGNLIATLAQEPTICDQLRADRSLMRHFLDESLRRDGPPQRLFRVATADCEVNGTLVSKGDWVAVFFAAANRDPDVFEDPDRFMLPRKNVSRHLSFGHGIHSCMGFRIARLEGEKLINGLLDAFPSINPGSGATKRQSGGLLNYGYENLSISLT
ncbi:MAG: cytochrome P450 [Pseudomonadota bacterium]